jgi:Ca2+-transporting ATPase
VSDLDERFRAAAQACDDTVVWHAKRGPAETLRLLADAAEELVLGGVPFLPLQTMWLNFTVNVFQAIGLGYGKPREGLMQVPPRPKEQKIMPRRLMTWLVLCGLVMAAGTLGVLAWAGNSYGDVIGRTMGVTTFALFRLFSSLETADEDESLFGGSILSNRPLLIGTGISVLSIILATELGFLQRILGTTSLTGGQWLVCIVLAVIRLRLDVIGRLGVDLI